MRLFSVILFLLLTTGLPAQEPRFVNYGPAEGLASSSVYAIAQDAEGLLWVGTRGGLFLFDGIKFEPCNDGLPALRVTSLTVDREGRLWTGTVNGLGVCGATALTGSHIRALCTDGEGFVWAATKDSLLVRLAFENDKVVERRRLRYDIGDFEGDYPVQHILPDGEGHLWLAGRMVHSQCVDMATGAIEDHYWNTGSYARLDGSLWAYDDYISCLLRYDRDSGDFVNIGRLPIAHAALLADSRGRLWAAGSYGLCLVNKDVPEKSTVYKPSSHELYCLFEDRNGNLWAGGDNGLSVICPALQHVKVISTEQVTALLQDSKGKMWIGTAGERISCFYEDREGAVYVGYWNNTGFDIFKGGKKTHGKIGGPIPKLQHKVADGDRVTSNWISDFLEGRDGRFWVVSWEGVGLNEWDRATGKTLPPEWLSPFKYPTADKDSSIYLSSRLGSRLTEDAEGNLVYGTTEAGLNIIDKDTRLVTKYLPGNSALPDNYVTDLCLAPDGKLWAATRSGLWTPSGEVLLPGKLVQSVESDSKGRLWAGTEEGLFFVDVDGSIGLVSKELGFPSNIYGEHVSCTLSDGSLAFGGPSGAAVFHPDSLLAIDAKGNIFLAGLVQHRYRIGKGEWINGRFSGFPQQMATGRYTVTEQSSDAFGRWETGSTISRDIRIPPPLALRWPFILFYLLVSAAIVWIVIRLRERRLLMDELDKRNQLFSIVSHDLRNPVSGNRLLSRQLLEQADQLSPAQLKDGLGALAESTENTSALLENLLLWSISQKGMLEPVMRTEDLAGLAAEAVGSVRKNEGIVVDIPAGMQVKTDRNMLLTCLRNLLDNAVKASPEGEKVVLKARGKQIMIADEGPGLQDGKVKWGHGLGLTITRELLDKMGAKLDFRNRPEGGLEITITL